MKQRYMFDYAYDKAFVIFDIDLVKFTNDHANATLDFFLWDYDKEGDPIDEVLKKYAIEVIQLATAKDLSLQGVIGEFNKREGFCPLDGSVGITLKDIRMFEFNDEDLRLIKSWI
ncbi:MAG: DUF2528 family protein [Flavobacteriales bacterium]